MSAAKSGSRNPRTKPSSRARGPAEPRVPGDRRAAIRYNLSLPISFQCLPGADGEPGSGTTRNVSIRGVYFLADREIAPGATLDLNFTLPAEATQGTEVFVRAQGRVVRTEKQGSAESFGFGLAAAIEKYEIVRVTPPF